MKPLPVPGANSLFLGDLLRAELADGTERVRAQVTRLKFVIAAADILQSEGYTELTVARIAKAAGFAHGTFYLHWSDRQGVALEVIMALMNAIKQHRPAPIAGSTFFDRLVIQHRFYISMYRQNAGLMQCQWQLADLDPTFGQVTTQANVTFARRALKAAEAEEPSATLSGAEGLATVMCCIGMVDKLLHDVCWRKLDLGLDDDCLAQTLSVTWYRALFARDPPPHLYET